MYKKIYLFSTLFYVAFFVLAGLFYKERGIFVDIAFHIFNIVKNNGSFAIQNYRFGAFFTQIYPCLATKLSLPLKGIVLSYSLGFAVYYFLCYLACGFVFKNYKMGLVLLLFQCLFTSHTFYWIQSELPQAIAFCIVLFASLEHNESNNHPIFQAWLYSGLFILGFFHPLILFVFSFALFFLLQRENTQSKQRMLLAGGLFYFIIILIKKQFFNTEYDKHAMEGAKNLLSTFPHYFRLYANKRFLINCSKIYYWIPVLSLLITVLYVKERKWLKLLLFGGYMIGYFLLVNVSYPSAGTTEFYIENLYLPMSIFIALPLVYDVLPNIKPKLAAGLIILICCTGIARIWRVHDIYTTRLNIERSLINQYQNDKVILSDASVPFDKLIMTWGSSYEIWLLSTIENGKTASIAIREHPSEKEWAINDRKAFISNWDVIDYTTLPPKYFPFKDTTNIYRIIK